MRRHIRTLTARHEPKGQMLSHVKSGSGAIVGLAAVGGLASVTGLPMLIAPLGATAVLLFGQPASPLAQPINIFAGYFIATLIGVAAAMAFPGLWEMSAVAVGVSIALMLMFRVTHPPAGAIPLVATATPYQGSTLFIVVLLSCISLLVLALVHHWIPPRAQYPRRVD
ncbi:MULTISPECIES: HPP family protein [Aminobacter]|jgi:CBS-domain-containing membrane protein|uniref:Membrane protein n=3 Tax=Aminobacter TaxID=31988 RepID=A0AAC8YRT3_AMIAI|nr:MULTISPECIES: HPP family protein [Aminobacter]AMS43091.1 Membrane protein [Aminobacter aminovorans]MBA8905401.1 CBS-domain-containing membrane protein [Aminobacter ciceronei]MBA9019299.1 CBS-domain-containing membrane protein [Aminobacter ciceronei]MBB3708525.1 CBS-domain-containing membrane protein [Aminobacter aminovorans]QOF72314.1 HPP family protein [Aminobacter sp. SR38]